MAEQADRTAERAARLADNARAHHQIAAALAACPREMWRVRPAPGE